VARLVAVARAALRGVAVATVLTAVERAAEAARVALKGATAATKAAATAT
jgi:hypothetical protein